MERIMIDLAISRELSQTFVKLVFELDISREAIIDELTQALQNYGQEIIRNIVGREQV